MNAIQTQQESSHVPVLMHEAVENLALVQNGRYVDATYGRGGHSGYLLSRLGEASQLLALDRDPDAIADANKRFAEEPRFSIQQSNFADMREVLQANGWLGEVDGLLLDLGVSSPQLDVAERGFGFSRDGDLDMRMDPTSGVSAAQWLAVVSEGELVQVLREYGEERYAKRIAGAIIAARAVEPILRTGQLAEIVKVAHPRWERHHHPATRSFQAIRIKINGELDAITEALSCAVDVLKVGGRMAVISFHSLEDRLVKRALRQPVPDSRIPRHLPQPALEAHSWKLIGKATKASAAELEVNPRARSATLRVAERVL
ncbi:16S rRNA (cytosine(1402)-N(4))-methyltransferase RsmH [Granulosicoccus antarcticus]|uniref:Ribosomal RNA small subunit methyltransferase H n=1 Tax=Granulosicoccus antarcticus IMCC3135 TaxID=1192854 RepID=A0A2Z2NZN6_9GAMM|nr:16S rRNA (cytosine(1402)-N(4))-methyltransferase RsmH [Granulosicoccus antarcticus]ASJ75895.1 Ribosomal RNA small subunit methyltransferase H [Granulosicoccus antarcticus IMCC3135]